MSSHITFFLAQWEEQHTHVLRSNLFGLIGVTEVQWVQIALVLINALSGQSLSNMKLADVAGPAVPGELSDKSLIWCMGLFTFVSGMLQGASSFFQTFNVLGCKKFI